MKKAFVSVMASILLASSTLAMAHSEGEEPQHGGILAEVKGVQYELVAKPDLLTIHVSDHGKNISTKGATAKITLLNGSDKTEATLSPAGENKLEAQGAFKVEKGTKAVAVVTLQGKPAQSIRFIVK